MRVSVVIPARDSAGTLAACLDGVAAQDIDHPFEVIVVDNGSSDDTAAIAQAHRVVDDVIRRPRGEGPGAARNAGALAARAETIAFLDSDCVPTSSWLREGVASLADIVQGRVVPADGVPVGPFDRTLWVTSEYGLYESANLFVERRWLHRVGGFVDFVDTSRERPFGEDAWWAWRARRCGATTVFADGALVHHAVFPGTAGQYLHERRRERYFVDLVGLVPELRRTFLYRGLFFSRRSAAFALASLSVGYSALRRTAGPLILAVPWLWLVRLEARRRAHGRGLAVAAVVAVGDVLSAGSRWRRGVLRRTPVV